MLLMDEFHIYLLMLECIDTGWGTSEIRSGFTSLHTSIHSIQKLFSQLPVYYLRVHFYKFSNLIIPVPELALITILKCPLVYSSYNSGWDMLIYLSRHLPLTWTALYDTKLYYLL